MRLPRSVDQGEVDVSRPLNGYMSIEIPGPGLGRWRRVPGVRVEVPYRRYAWESYHSAMNDFSGFHIPAASIIDKLKLRTWNREVDFRESDGRLVTLYREQVEDRWDGDTHMLLYMRRDCLSRYLAKTRQTLVWCN